MDCSPPGPSIHGILQARILEWVAISFSKGSSQPRDRTQVSCIAGRCFNSWATYLSLKKSSWYAPPAFSAWGYLKLMQFQYLRVKTEPYWGQPREPQATEGGYTDFRQCENHSVVSSSLWPHGLYSPWNSPSQNTGVSSLSLLQGIFPTQRSNPGFPHCRRILYQLSHQGSPGIQVV